MGVPNRKYRAPREKLETVQLYLMLGGSVSKTAGALKIPEDTIWTWRKTDWWNEMENAIRREENLELSSKLKRVMGKSLEILEDRLEHGDWIYDQKTGKMVRKPVSLKDAQKTVVDFIDKREQLTKQQNHSVASEQIEDKLAKLAKAFSDLSKPKLEVTDVVFATEVLNEPPPEEEKFYEFSEGSALHALDEGRQT